MADWIDGDTDEIRGAAADLDGSQMLRITDRKRAYYLRRRIERNIWSCDTAAALANYWQEERPMVDALGGLVPVYATELYEIHAEARAAIAAGRRRNPSPAVPGSQRTGAKMAGNPDFKKVVWKDVRLVYPRLDQPYRFNAAEQRSEPAPNGAWSVGVIIDMAAAKELAKEAKAHYEDCRSRNSKLPAFSKVFGLKQITDGEDAGKAQVTAKRNAVTASGSAARQPQVVDGNLQSLDNLSIWTGSRGAVRALMYPVRDPQGNGGISFMLDAVQVVEAVYGGGGDLSDDFETYDAPNADPFGDAEKAKPAPASAGIDDDEIPF